LGNKVASIYTFARGKRKTAKLLFLPM